MITLIAEELSLVRQWSEGCRRSGREFQVLDASALVSGSQLHAGVCLFDLGPRGGADTTGLTRALAAYPQCRFVALSARPSADEGLQLLRAGVRGYCNRQASDKAAVAVLDTVEAGEIWASRQVTDFLLAQAIGGATALDGTGRPALFQALTRRETEIAEQVAAGHSNKMIAAEAGITERTVKTHLNNIFRKTGVRNRVQLALAVNDAEDVPRRLSSG